MKSRTILFIGVFAVLLFSLTLICVGVTTNNNNHSGSPYKIYIANRYIRGGLIIITSEVDVNSRKLKLEYFPD